MSSNLHFEKRIPFFKRLSSLLNLAAAVQKWLTGQGFAAFGQPPMSVPVRRGMAK